MDVHSLQLLAAQTVNSNSRAQQSTTQLLQMLVQQQQDQAVAK